MSEVEVEDSPDDGIYNEKYSNSQYDPCCAIRNPADTKRQDKVKDAHCHKMNECLKQQTPTLDFKN